jgi:hypothetical protein
MMVDDRSSLVMIVDDPNGMTLAVTCIDHDGGGNSDDDGCGDVDVCCRHREVCVYRSGIAKKMSMRRRPWTSVETELESS